MKTDSFSVEQTLCTVCLGEQPSFLLIQPADESDLHGLGREAAEIEAAVGSVSILAAFHVSDWNRDLTAWDAPAVFGKKAFGHGADDTLAFVEQKLIPACQDRFDLSKEIPVILGGYSLAGLFSLWAASMSGHFSGVMSASASLWYPGWQEYAKKHPVQAKYVYLSLGDREDRSKNPVLAQIRVRTCEQLELLREQPDIVSTLEWNEGNHFHNPDLRCAKGFAWCIKQGRSQIKE